MEVSREKKSFAGTGIRTHAFLFKAAEVISKTAKRLILLSGTPALSRPLELFSQISLVDPTLFPYFNDFGIRYCDGKKISFGAKEVYDFQGSSNMNELRLIMEAR